MWKWQKSFLRTYIGQSKSSGCSSLQEGQAIEFFPVHEKRRHWEYWWAVVYLPQLSSIKKTSRGAREWAICTLLEYMNWLNFIGGHAKQLIKYAVAWVQNFSYMTPANLYWILPCTKYHTETLTYFVIFSAYFWEFMLRKEVDICVKISIENFFLK